MCKQWFLLLLVALVAVGFQCRIKWHLHGQNCYRIMNHKATFSTAQKICKLYNSKLLVLRSFEELKNAFEMFSDSQFFWVTLNMTEEKDMDIQNMQDSLYAIPVINGTQMRSSEEENCFVITKSNAEAERHVLQKSCSLRYNYICQKNVETDNDNGTYKCRDD
ncbi:Snaclec 3 [Trichinella pseudospiralis]|uniref:Snaclec 3 n=2 Tax=Trichinella pseudospiralis TaxID=6337 RepID=A0A0V1FYJ8_TRIPS|nr:Snaclec 3 [Trichinella pseudospiralis]KRY76448.1 Snaclec 3 [Trichinella pseudospiralis]KRY91126.1 Snaclec 3 [Trichinella pseudospiralis]KRZ26992.1 Snaclec 3 [Trichinella pseudospiralis]KRZ41496.1 Snaclec 3 [Trichinella pseudospiralis]